MLVSTAVPCFTCRTQCAEADVPSLVTPNVIYGGNLTMRQVWIFFAPASVCTPMFHTLSPICRRRHKHLATDSVIK